DELDAGALRPQLELLDAGGAERVRRAEHDRQAELVAQVPGQLPDRGRLAGAVDAGDEDHRRVVPEVDAVLTGPCEVGEQLGQAAGSWVRRLVRASPPVMSPSVASRSSCPTTLPVVPAPTSA